MMASTPVLSPRIPARLEVQHESGYRCLQGKRRDYDTQVDCLAVAGKRNGDNQNHDDAKDSDQVTRHGCSPGVGLVVLVGCKDTPKSGIPIENLVNNGAALRRIRRYAAGCKQALFRRFGVRLARSVYDRKRPLRVEPRPDRRNSRKTD